MRIDILTLFPEMFAGPFDASIIARARAAGVLDIALHNPRDYTTDKHRIVDDYAYGGGPGMVMKPEPIFDCVAAVRPMADAPGKVVLLTPQGRLLNHEVVAELAAEPRLILICGHYEGVDERVRAFLVDDEISIGDYVLSGGEAAAMVLVDAVARHQPGVLGSELSLEEESHAQGLLEYPQYTRPPEYRGHAVPEVLLSGHHAEIAKWRRHQSILHTARRRPDLLARADLTAGERRLVEEELVGEDAEGKVGTRLYRVIVPVSDIDRAAAFYGALLGAPGERVSGGRHEFDCGGTLLACVDPRGDDPAEEVRPNPDHVYFAVPDLKAAFERAKAAGCAWIEKKIATRPWGERCFYARDPFGNPICVVDEDTLFTGGRFVP
jgi:tRNA (guanine37-N1)-methyltransferase